MPRYIRFDERGVRARRAKLSRCVRTALVLGVFASLIIVPIALTGHQEHEMPKAAITYEWKTGGSVEAAEVRLVLDGQEIHAVTFTPEHGEPPAKAMEAAINLGNKIGEWANAYGKQE